MRGPRRSGWRSHAPNSHRGRQREEDRYWSSPGDWAFTKLIR